ncbi:MAG: YdcF family protein [Desulfobacterales bacterium]|nr:YdcF family protein [Desulfobacterales bacterium]
MFVFKKLITPFLLPPGIFILAALVAAVLCWRRKQRLSALFMVLAAVALWLPALKPVAHLLHRGLVAEYTALSTEASGDVIVLLGGGINDKARDMTGMGVPTSEMMVRIVTAVRLQKRLGVPVIVSGGAVYDQARSEAVVIRRFLMDLGVPDRLVFMEEKSRDTYDNAVFSRQICLAHGFQRPILVTSDYHMKRAVMTFQRAGLPVSPFPTPFPSDLRERYGWWTFLPESYEHTAACLKEYIGWVYYRFAFF